MPVTAATYTIKVRLGIDLIGEVDVYDKFEMISRFNNVGSWSLTLAADHPMATFLATPGYGIYVLRNNTYYFSGPVRLIDRRGVDTNSLMVAGYDDMFWLATRQIYPGGFLTYDEFISLTSVLRLYDLSDNTNVAVDTSPFGQNGTINGVFSQGQPTLLDDPSTATSFGAGGYVTVPTTGLPSGNAAFGIMTWFTYTGAPAATEVLGFLGTSGGANCAYMGVLTSGKPTMQLKGVNTSSATALTVGDHFMFLDYDGTTAKLKVDGVVVATATPGVCTITYGVASFGAYGAGVSNFALCTMQKACIFQGHLGNASLPGSVLNGVDWPIVFYDLGVSGFNINQYDSESGPAETVIKTYANFNAGPGAITARQVPHLTIEADAAQGSNVTYNARFDNLLQMDMGGALQVLATAGGVGMKVIQLPGSLDFQVYVPTVAPKGKFSVDLGNLGSFEYINDFQSMSNYVVVAGGGEGTSRSFYQTGDAASIATYGRCEQFNNGGTSTDKSQLAMQAGSSLASTANKLTFNAEFYETDGIQYVRDFNLGDTVSVTIDGVTLTDIMREVSITLDAANGETLRIGIGTPANGQIISAMQKYQQTASALNTRLTFLERV